MIRDVACKIKEICKRKGYKKILIQMPEGLRVYIKEFLEVIEGIDVFFSLDSCYGACDVKKEFDATFHIAHTKIFDVKDVYYIDYFQEVKSLENLLRNLNILPKNIGIVTTAQFGNYIMRLKNLLERYGKKVYVEKGKYSKFPGQIFGCYFEPAIKIEKYVDCFLFFGTGFFHPIGLSLAVEKDVYSYDPILNKFLNLKEKKEKYLKRRYIEISRALATDMKNIGIIISTKLGQKRIGTAIQLKKSIEEIGSKPYMLVMDEVTPDKLTGLNLDFYINTACPRIIDDSEKFKDFIILNPNEFYILLGKVDKYVFTQYF